LGVPTRMSGGSLDSKVKHVQAGFSACQRASPFDPELVEGSKSLLQPRRLKTLLLIQSNPEETCSVHLAGVLAITHPTPPPAGCQVPEGHLTLSLPNGSRGPPRLPLPG